MKFGLQARLMTSLAAVITLLVLVIGWWWIEVDRRALDAGLQQRQARMISLLQRGLAAPIWNLDHTTIDNLLEAVVADPEVHRIELKGLGLRGGRAVREREGTPVQPFERTFEISYQATADSPSAEVAQGVLVYSRELLEQQVAGSRRFVIQLLAVVVAAVMLACYALVNWWVRRPVERLGALAQRVAEGQLGAQAPVERADEIGDLTERFNSMSRSLQEAGAAMRQSESRYRGLFENATEGIFQTDEPGHVLSMNRAMRTLLGLTGVPEGQRLSSLLGVSADEMAPLNRVMLEQGRLQQVPLQLHLGEGREIWIELSAHWVEEEGQAGRRVIEGMVSDITQRRLAEAELTRHRDHLEELVAERTAELRDATARAQAASEAKGRFLATMSHEFRTPLNGILGFTQLLQMDASLTATHQHRLGLMRESGEHLLSLISDVLDMASIEAGKVSIKPTKVDLRALLDMVADSVRLRAEQKGLAFGLVVEGELPTHLMIDGQRLRQVLLNLLSNAIKFTDRGTVGIQASVSAQDAASVRLRFSVQDTGIGMSPAQQARLFQAFEQVGESARTHGGTGLGLSISQELVRRMGGQITVQSAAGAGSRFSFELLAPVV